MWSRVEEVAMEVLAKSVLPWSVLIWPRGENLQLVGPQVPTIG